MKYLDLSTPDKQYYVGIDMPSALHPQTLLCYELNGKPLPMNQGYPLRLIIPVKYGVKSLKRIGYMYFDKKRPPDYWAERRDMIIIRDCDVWNGQLINRLFHNLTNPLTPTPTFLTIRANTSPDAGL